MNVLRIFLRIIFNPWTVLLVLAAGVGTAYYLTAGEDDESNDNAASPRQAIPVEAMEVQLVTLRETVRGIGTLRAMAVVEIRPEIAARVLTIEFEEGGEVTEGQILFRLDDSKLQRQLASRQASLRSARARLANAQLTYNRLSRMRAEGVATEDEYDRARTDLAAHESQVDELEADVELVREQLKETVLHAPFDGMISEQHVDPGAFAQVADHLATVYRTDPLEIAFHVPERYLGRVQRRQRVEVLIAAYPEQSFEGEVHFISPAVREATRDFLVRAYIPNPDRRLKPGAFATALLVVAEHPDRPVVPEESLVATRHGYLVYVLNDHTAERRSVRTGIRDEGLVEVIEGLNVGDRVVRTGHMRLSGGEAVTITNE